MPNVSIKITGTEQVLAALQSRIDSLRVQVDQAIQGAGINTEAQAKQACPVDTGRLRSSIQYNPGILSCTVGTNVNYGPYIEYGTYKMKAQPFLYPAFRSASSQLFDELKAMSV